MEYTVEEIDRIGARLLTRAPLDPAKRKLDKQAAIRRIKEQIATVQERGYTLEQIAASLTEEGLEITTPTLKSYLQRADLGGEVLHANSNAEILLERDAPGVSRSLAEAIAAGAGERGWDLMPLRGSEQPRGFLAIMRPLRHQVVVPDLIRAASQRWHLTARQTEVLSWVARGLTNVAIAETLRISEGTVEFHLKIIFDKAGVDNRATLIVKLMEL